MFQSLTATTRTATAAASASAKCCFRVRRPSSGTHSITRAMSNGTRRIIPAEMDRHMVVNSRFVPDRLYSAAPQMHVDDDDEGNDEYPPLQSIFISKEYANHNTNSINKNSKSKFSTIIPEHEIIHECTCGYRKQQELLKDKQEPMPPLLPKPVYSVHKRVLPNNLIALSSLRGRQYLMESLSQGTAESYWSLTEQFVNQSDPAFCGVTTLLMVLNAMNVDPNVRWKGGWRFYGDEDVLLQRCCLNAERIRRAGITMEQFMILGTCHGLRIQMKRPPPTSTSASESGDNDTPYPYYSLQEFRKDLQDTLDSLQNRQHAIMVTSFSRLALQQTGDGHFSPIAAYHAGSDSVLILDVARFKYAPYWVSVEELYRSMQPLDSATQLPRGWYIMKPPTNVTLHHHPYSLETKDEDRRPAHLVPLAHEKEPCPIGEIKVQFCPAAKEQSQLQQSSGGESRGTPPKELQ